MKNHLVIMVTGGRDYDDTNVIAEALGNYSSLGTILLNGGAKGADFYARRYWHQVAELPYVTMPAPWHRVGKPAGQLRNMAMVAGNSIAPYGKLVPDVVLAFPGGKGTAGAVKAAVKAGIEVVRYE